jgi:transposase
MSYLRGWDRAEIQLLPPCVDDYVPADCPARFIEAYVEGVDFKGLGFTHCQPAETGRPAYHPADLLKLYIYGYLYRIRSSRRLEAEAGRNLELIWLLGGLRPDFKTIADFRKDNRAAFKPLFKQFNLLCRKLDLFGAELVAIDGSKFKALNNSRRYYTQAQLQELVAKIEERIEHYLSELDGQDAQAEGAGPQSKKQQLEEKIELLRRRKGSYDELLGDLQQKQSNQIALTDPDARKMKAVQGYVVGYNVQLTVDAKHDLIVCNEVVQSPLDQEQLAAMAVSAKQELQAEKLQATADRGYHDADQLETAEQNGIEAFVPEKLANSGHPVFSKKQFRYDAQRDVYECPAGQVLSYQRQDRNHGKLRKLYYNEQVCAGCHLRSQCTNARHRIICRRTNEDTVERTRTRVAQRPDLINRRKEIVEHVFGTLRNWGHDRFLLKGLEKVRAEFALSALVYNLRRVLTIVPMEKFLKTLNVNSAPEAT